MYSVVLSEHAWFFRSELYLSVQARTGQGLQKELIGRPPSSIKQFTSQRVFVTPNGDTLPGPMLERSNVKLSSWPHAYNSDSHKQAYLDKLGSSMYFVEKKFLSSSAPSILLAIIGASEGGRKTRGRRLLPL